MFNELVPDGETRVSSRESVRHIIFVGHVAVMAEITAANPTNTGHWTHTATRTKPAGFVAHT